MASYAVIARELDRVRRAWKRTAALSGLAIVVLEAIGFFSLALFVDLLFRPGLPGRVIMLAVGLASVAVFALRNVLRPLFRDISDETLALFVEEHNPGFEGALIAAAEFGTDVDLDRRHHDIVQAILREAEERAKRLDVRSAIDLTRLRKYGVAAAACLVFYGCLGLLFPNDVGKHATRVLVPWKPEEQDEPVVPEVVEKLPIEFALSRADSDILRGTPFDLEATLSREPDKPVFFHFRPLAAGAEDGQWHMLFMEQIEKLHGYAVVLPDVNEAMEFFVSSEGCKSGKHTITVYDPLVVEGIRVAIKYPDYLHLPDRLQASPTGDISAPVGSTATVTILTNRPLADGTLTWDQGETQPFAVGTEDTTTASVLFEITEHRSYRYAVRDIREQLAESPAPAFVQAVPDQGPSIELVTPTAEEPAKPTPLDEIEFEAKVADDFGVERVDFVFRRGAAPDAPEQRLPATLESHDGGLNQVATAAFVFELETLDPPVQPKEVFSYYLETRDRKGQTAVTQFGIMPVRFYEIWATEEWSFEAHIAHEQPPELPMILQAVWELHHQRDDLAPADFERQCREIAAEMIDPSTNRVWVFAEPKPGDTPPPDVRRKMDRINALAKDGHGRLAKHDTGQAVEKLREAVLIMVELGLVEDVTELLAAVSSSGAPESTSEFEEQMEALTLLETQAPEVKSEDAKIKQEIEQAEKTKEQSQEIEELEKRQQDVVDKARDLAKQQETREARDAPRQQREQQALATKQQDVAQQTKTAAQQIEQVAEGDRNIEQAADRMREAAHKMQKAADEMRKGRMEQAAQQAQEARQELAGVREQLIGFSQDQLTAALNDAERRARKLVQQQQQVRQQTEAVAEETAGEQSPTDRQQRDMKVLATQQARLKSDLENLESAVNSLKNAADSGAVKHDTAKYVQDAGREMRRGRIDTKMTNAAVELTSLRPQNAAPDQQRAEKSLERVLEHIRLANDSIAAGHEAELRRARGEARRADELLTRLNPKADAKVQAEQKLAPPPATQHKPTPTAPEERAQMAEDAAATIAQLERHVQARKFVQEQTLRALEPFTQDAATLEHKAESDDKETEILLGTVRKVHLELEDAYKTYLASKRLFSAQREECPPQYRHMVNRYFEVLSARAE